MPRRPAPRGMARLLLAAIAVLALDAGAASATAAADAASTSRASSLPGWLHTSGATIRTASGSRYTIKAVAWFDMETSTCAPQLVRAVRPLYTGPSLRAIP